MRKNPFNRVAEAAGCAGVIVLALAAVAGVVGAVMSMVAEDVNLLWQVPLAFAVLVGGALGIGKLGELFAKKWRKWSVEWDRKHGDL